MITVTSAPTIFTLTSNNWRLQNLKIKKCIVKNTIYKIILLCFKFQITIGTKPRNCFALLSKHYSKTYRTLSNFFAHKFSKFSANISISKNTKKNTTRKQWKVQNEFWVLPPFFVSFPYCRQLWQFLVKHYTAKWY